MAGSEAAPLMSGTGVCACQLVVNLSTLYSGGGLSAGIDAFANLYDLYGQTQTGCLSCCPIKFFRDLSAKLAVQSAYSANQDFINAYKLGSITTDAFLDRMYREFFPFMSDGIPNVEERDRVQADLLGRRGEYFSLREVASESTTLTDEQIAKALLEGAWNSVVEHRDDDDARFEQLVAERDAGKRIFLISNTNELNVDKTLRELRRRFSAIGWIADVDFSVPEEASTAPIEVAPNIFLCLSYKYQLWKGDAEQVQAGTPGLVQTLIDRTTGDPKHVKVISQFPRDIEAAKACGVPERNCQAASEYYESWPRSRFCCGCC